MNQQKFLTKPRQRWLAKYFNGLSLISAAGIASETFVKLGHVWRIASISVLLGSFVFGLLFAKAQDSHQEE